jgi:hypothetical protein
VEFVKVDELLVDVLTIVASVAFTEEKVDLLVDRPEDFGREFLVSGDSIFVLDAFLCDFSDKNAQLAR